MAAAAPPVVTFDPRAPRCDIPLIGSMQTAKMPSVIAFTLAVGWYYLNGLFSAGGQFAISGLIPFFFTMLLAGSQTWVIWAQGKYYNKCPPVNWIGILLAWVVGILGGTLGYWGAYWASGNVSQFNIVPKADLSQSDILSQAKTINDQAAADAAASEARRQADKAAADKAAKNRKAIDANIDILRKSGYEGFSNSTPFAINSQAANLNSSGSPSTAAFLANQMEDPTQKCSPLGENGVAEIEIIRNGRQINSIVAEPIA